MKITFTLIKWIIIELTIGAMIVLTAFADTSPENKVTWILIEFVAFLIAAKSTDEFAR